MENVCFFGDSCWFQHSEYFRNSEPTFRCNFCDEKFRTQNAFREHMKLMHFQFVVKCKHANECKFGPRKCWFIHQENIEIAYQNAKNEGQINDNNEIDDMEWKMKTNVKLDKIPKWIKTRSYWQNNYIEKQNSEWMAKLP